MLLSNHTCDIMRGFGIIAGCGKLECGEDLDSESIAAGNYTTDRNSSTVETVVEMVG